MGVCATLGVALLGGLLGGLAGFFGGASDAILSRVTDIFFAIPVVLGGLVLLSVVTSNTVWPVIGFMVLLGWPQISRIARGAVITAKQHDYVQAARALGASNSRMMLRHVAPNAVAPVIVVATIALGTYIALEATLSYLGVGLKPPRSAGASTSRPPRRTSATPRTCSSGRPARWRSPCSRSSCSATRCATPSIPSCAEESAAMLLEVRDLHVEFHTRDGVAKAVNGVNYSVSEGETLAVLGESGSGKSVTAQAIMGILDMPPGKISGGEILFKDRDLLKLKKEERRKIRGQEMAMIFQDALSSLNPVLTVGEQLGEMFVVHRGRPARTRRPRPSS